jgi:conjugative transposon TraM protein
MDNVQKSQAFLRKRKMMMVIPFLVLPFLTMAFWAMGGGKASSPKTDQTKPQGLNLKLPNASFKDEKFSDKMSFYDQADRDSLKMAELMRNDPYYHHEDSMQANYSNDLQQIAQNAAGKFNQNGALGTTGLKLSPYDKAGTPTEEKVMKKLAELNNIINQPEKNRSEEKDINQNKDQQYGFGDDVNRLESMMKSVSDHGDGNDPELKQLENTLDKILDVQHPERVKDRIKEKSLANKQAVFKISKTPKEESISLIDTGNRITREQSGFFGIDDETSTDVENNVIEAVVNENQVLVNGAVVKFRLLNDVYINGALIPTGTFVFGIASLTGERLEIDINSIRYQKSLYPVKLQVYDIDGLSGIYIPGAITRDVAKQSVDNSLQLLELSSMDPSLKTQATAAGIDAAKSMLSKKVKQIKVLVKAGYRVLLKDKSTQ